MSIISKRYRWDRDLEILVEIGGNSNFFEEKGAAPAVISDDVGAGVAGLRHLPSGKMLDSKSAHRRENKARGLVEVGNETNFATRRPPQTLEEYGAMVKESREQIAGNWNGIADRLQRDRERG